jgi:hypothetical protein
VKEIKMKKENFESNRIVSIKILAQTMHELAPDKSVEFWENHIKNTGHDPKEFFGTNGEGLQEYDSFTRTHDKDNRKRQQEIKNRKRR